MRRALLVALGMMMAGPLWAQGSGRMFVGAPRNIKFEPIDVSRAISPSNVNRGFYRPSSSLMTPPKGNPFPKISMPSLPGPIPQTSVMPQSQNIFQPNPPKGINPFNPPKAADKSVALIQNSSGPSLSQMWQNWGPRIPQSVKNAVTSRVGPSALANLATKLGLR